MSKVQEEAKNLEKQISEAAGESSKSLQLNNQAGISYAK